MTPGVFSASNLPLSPERKTMLEDKSGREKEFRSARKLVLVVGVIGIAVSIAMLGFVVWVVVKILQHFGIV